MAFDVLVINANPLLNLVHAGDFVPGAVNRVPRLAMLAEGKGVNVARILARHGHRVILTGFAGGHSGAWLRDLVHAEGVEDACVETTAPLRVGFMASGPGADHPTTVFPNGFPVTPAECRTLLDQVEALLDSVRLVIASGSMPDPAAEDLYSHVLSLCAERSVPCWVDAYGPCMRQALTGPVAPALAKPNRDELEPGLPWQRVGELHITDGAAAIEVSHPEEGYWRVIPPAIRQVNPVGSGDCYVAGLAHGWLEGYTFAERLRYAAAAGAANALRQEVAMIAPDEVVPLLDRVRMERL
jgi:1-phosphofructokinase family hexose kinase